MPRRSRSVFAPWSYYRHHVQAPPGTRRIALFCCQKSQELAERFCPPPAAARISIDREGAERARRRPLTDNRETVSQRGNVDGSRRHCHVGVRIHTFHHFRLAQSRKHCRHFWGAKPTQEREFPWNCERFLAEILPQQVCTQPLIENDPL